MEIIHVRTVLTILFSCKAIATPSYPIRHCIYLIEGNVMRHCWAVDIPQGHREVYAVQLSVRLSIL